MAGNDWPTISLSELYDFGSGLSKPRSEFGFGHAFLSFKDIFENYFVPDRLTHLVNSTPNEQKVCSIRRGDVFLTRTSETMDELGMSCVALKDYDQATFNGFTKRLRPKVPDRIVPEYAAYYFRSPKFRRDVTAMSSLSTRASLNNEMLSRLTVLVPPTDTQESIGFTLKALDDKIELNRRMNATLEAMARALFQSWFVDFDPVRAKLDGRQPAGLDPATDALFPNEFQDSELGPIPKGWKVDTIKNRASNIQYGFTQSASSEPIGPHFLRITDIRGGTIEWASVPFCQATDAEREKYRVMDGDIFIARTGASTGDNIYVVEPPPAVFASYLIRLQFGSRGLGRLVGEFARTPDYANHIAGTIGGSAQPNASAQTLASATMMFPPETIAEAFYRTVRPLDLRRAANDRESSVLVTLRDTLLPKLLSGELRVPENRLL